MNSPNPLAEAFALAVKVRPNLCQPLMWCEVGPTWLVHGRPVEESVAEMLIEAACVRELPGWAWARDVTGKFHVLEMRADRDNEKVADTITLALLAAVAGEGGRKDG